jgi:hypothetical protein
LKRVLKNQAKQPVTTFFRGRNITIKKKASKIFDMDDEEEAAEYYYWKQMYGFMQDITTRVGDLND